MKTRAIGIVLTALLSATGSRATAQSALAGTVISDPGDHPLAQAEIIVAGADRTVRSDSLGAFRLIGIPAGTHQVTVRLAGYKPWTGALQFRDAQTIEADFVLQAIATELPGVDVNARAPSRNPRLIEFEERRRSGVGRFITTDVFEKNSTRSLSSVILAQVPGVKVIERTGDRILNSMHDGQSQCPVQVVLNGVAVFTGTPTEEPFNIDSIQAETCWGSSTTLSRQLQLATWAQVEFPLAVTIPRELPAARSLFGRSDPQPRTIWKLRSMSASVGINGFCGQRFARFVSTPAYFAGPGTTG